MFEDEKQRAKEKGETDKVSRRETDEPIFPGIADDDIEVDIGLGFGAADFASSENSNGREREPSGTKSFAAGNSRTSENATKYAKLPTDEKKRETDELFPETDGPAGEMRIDLSNRFVSGMSDSPESSLEENLAVAKEQTIVPSSGSEDRREAVNVQTPERDGRRPSRRNLSLRADAERAQAAMDEREPAVLRKKNMVVFSKSDEEAASVNIDAFWKTKEEEDWSTGLHGKNVEFTNAVRDIFFCGRPITDIHITEGKKVWIREAGSMEQLDILAPKGGISSFCSEVLRMPSYDRANSSCEFAGKRLRLRFSKTLHANQLFVRLLSGRAPELHEIGHEVTFEKIAGKVVPGIVFVAGATGSGKSTMLASVLQKYLDTEPIHMSTAEDPVEYRLFDGVGEVSQREIPDDTPDFATAVKNVLREDPDIIFIGEMRDPETAKTALTAAETGHLVFATVHASGIGGIIDRLYGMLDGVPDAQLRLSEAFLGGVYLLLQRDGPKAIRRTFFLWVDEKGEVRKRIREKRVHEMDEMATEILAKEK